METQLADEQTGADVELSPETGTDNTEALESQDADDRPVTRREMQEIIASNRRAQSTADRTAALVEAMAQRQAQQPQPTQQPAVSEADMLASIADEYGYDLDDPLERKRARATLRDKQAIAAAQAEARQARQAMYEDASDKRMRDEHTALLEKIARKAGEDFGPIREAIARVPANQVWATGFAYLDPDNAAASKPEPKRDARTMNPANVAILKKAGVLHDEPQGSRGGTGARSYTREQLNSMTPEEYRQNRPEILRQFGRT